MYLVLPLIEQLHMGTNLLFELQQILSIWPSSTFLLTLCSAFPYFTTLLLIRLSDGGGTFVSEAASHSFGQAAGETPTILNQKSFVQKSVLPIDFFINNLFPKLKYKYVL